MLRDIEIGQILEALRYVQMDTRQNSFADLQYLQVELLSLIFSSHRLVEERQIIHRMSRELVLATNRSIKYI